MPCLTQLELVCRRQIWQRAIVGTCWVLVTVVLTAVGLMGLDYLFGFRWPALRLLVSASLAVSGLWMASHLLAGWRKITPVEVALQLERYYPELGDRLASAVQFSEVERAGEPLGTPTGSAALRREVMLRVAQEAKEIDWNQLLPRQTLGRAILAVLLVAVGVGGIVMLAPRTFQIGLTRLIHPLGQAHWPQRHDLHLIDPPEFVAAGESFEVRLRDRRGALPEKVWIHYRVAGASAPGDWDVRQSYSWQEFTEPMRRSGQTMVARWVAGSTRIEFRATGGDDRAMPWHKVRVVERPRVESLEIMALPPAYTGRAAQTLKPPFRVLAGSGLEIHGKSSVPIGRVRLLGQQNPLLEARLAVAGRSFQIGSLGSESPAWIAAKSETYALELTTPDGWTVRPQQLPLVVVSDMPPRVTWVEPSGDLTVVANARVDLVVAATDDLGLSEVSLVCRLAETAAAEQGEPVVLFRQAGLHGQNLASVSGLREQVTTLELPHTLRLSGWGLQPGQTLLVEGQARDTLAIDGQSAPQTGRTDRPLRLRIVSRSTMLRLVQQRQILLVERLTTTLESQQAVRDRLSVWSPPSAGAADSLGPREWMSRQRQIADGLDHASGRLGNRGAVQQLDQLLRLYRSNRLVDPETDSRLDRLRTDLARLARRALPDVEARLHNLLLSKSLLPPESTHSQSAADEAEPNLFTSVRDEIVQRQDDVIGRLQQALEELGHWNTLQQLARQWQQLQRDQRRWLECSRDELAPQFWTEPLGTDSGESMLPTSEHERIWNKAVAAQRRLARRMGRLIPHMESAADRRTATQPEVARRLARVASTARRQSIQATLQAAADQLSQRRLGRAMKLQQQALEQMQRLGEQLLGKQHAGTTEDGQRQDRQADSRESGGASRQPDGSHGNSQPGSTPAPAAGQSQTAPLSARTLPESVGSLVHELWGSLPAGERQQILQPVSEDFLPRYAADIAAYFRALAEPATEEALPESRRSEP